MRWKTKRHPVMLPTEGDYRIKEKFLLFPKCIGNEYRWLEYAKWTEFYTWVIDIYRTSGKRLDWKPTEWTY